MRTIRSLAQLDIGAAGKDGARDAGKSGVNGGGGDVAGVAGGGSGSEGKDGPDDMSLIDEDDPAILASDAAQLFPALQVPQKSPIYPVKQPCITRK